MPTEPEKRKAETLAKAQAFVEAHCAVWGKEETEINCAEGRWLGHQFLLSEEQRERAINSVLSRSLAEKAREQINRGKEQR